MGEGYTATVNLTLLRNADLYAPEPLGRRDLLVTGGRVVALSEPGASLEALPASYACEEHDCAGARVVPGLVDAHVHVTGGGGEGSFCSRVPPLSLSQLSLAGVTSVVGVLGTDGSTRTMRELVARTYGLREEGLSAWCWTGSYEIPVRTLTGSVRDDLVFVDPIIGVGELAISDHRSSQPSFDEFLRVASDVHVAGMLAGKAGVLHLHLGDGERGLDLVRRALDHSELPGRVFHPTHLNRRRELFAEAQAVARELGELGPCMDITAFPEDDVGEGLSAAEAIATWKRAGLPLERLTCSSDGGGCMPHFDAHGSLSHYGVGQSATLLETIREAVVQHGLELAELLPLFGRNVARLLRLNGKGELAPGSDADLIILDEQLRVDAVMARGRWLVRGGEAVVCGPFERA
jgi:beta-aspartyl-dipeptidase (metallo-type)